MKRSWTLEFCKAFKDQVPQEVGYSIQTHLGHLDAELLHSLKDSRCQRVVVGVESGNRRILGLLNRKADPEVMRERLGLLSAFRFPLGTMTLNLLGNPTETVAEMLDTVFLNASAQVERVRYHILAPYPRSPIHDLCEAEQLFLGDKDLMAYQDRHLTKLRFPPKEAGFLERFGDIGHWYMNLLAPFGLEREYQPLVDELAELPAGVWPEVRERFLRVDAELNAAHQRKGQRHYRPFLNEGLTLPTLGLFDGATV